MDVFCDDGVCEFLGIAAQPISDAPTAAIALVVIKDLRVQFMAFSHREVNLDILKNFCFMNFIQHSIHKAKIMHF